MSPGGTDPGTGDLVWVERPAAPGAPILLLLHGLNSNERDLMGLAPALQRGLHLVSVRAPVQLAHDGYGWFPVQFTPAGSVIDAPRERRSRGALAHLVQRLRQQHAPAAMLALGFSQGGMMALNLLLTGASALDGVLALSARLLPEIGPEILPPARLAGAPVFLAHGTGDAVIPVERARAARATLEALGVSLSYHEYPMGHQVSEREVADVNAWIAGRLGAGAG